MVVDCSNVSWKRNNKNNSILKTIVISYFKVNNIFITVMKKSLAYKGDNKDIKYLEFILLLTKNLQ